MIIIELCVYRSVNEAIKKAKKKIVIGIMDFPVREKENLLPATVYAKYTDVPLIHVIADHYAENEIITCYFDIKGGIKYKKILNPNKKWLSYFEDLIDKCRKANICDEELSEKNEDEYYILGIGDKLCGSVADALFDGNEELVRSHFANMNKDEVSRLCQERDKVLAQIPEFVIRNWKQISDDIFTWGCCIDNKRYPAQREW